MHIDSGELPGPVPPRERIVAIDVVRGLAVLGILVMNVVEFALPMEAYENPVHAGGHEGADLWTWYLQVVLFDGKMRALFSMLFGAGLVLIARRLADKGMAALSADLLLRRCLWLVPFGLVHRFALQWTGDILYMYGLLGALAVAFRSLRPRTQIVLGLLALTAFVPIGALLHHRLATMRNRAEAVAAMTAEHREVPAELATARASWQGFVRRHSPDPVATQKEIDAVRGGYLDVFAYRWDFHHQFQSAFLYEYFVWDVFGMMLIGMGLLQLGFFSGAWPTRAYLGCIAAGVIVAATTYWWASAWHAADFSPAAIDLRFIKDATYAYSRGIVGLAWASALILIVRSGALRWATVPLAAVGRMAFSNYVLQTICCTLLFFGYGFGLYGSLSRAQLMGVVAAVSALQVVFSVLWLSRFRFGPLEWAWRSLTWWQRQPLRRELPAVG